MTTAHDWSLGSGPPSRTETLQSLGLLASGLRIPPAPEDLGVLLNAPFARIMTVQWC